HSGTYFARATDAFGGDTSSNAVVKVLGRQTPVLPLIEFTNSWRFEQSGTDLGSAWRSPAYDDSQWNVGQGVFFYANYATSYPEPINTALLQLDDFGASRLTDYFRTHFNYRADTPNVLLVSPNLLESGPDSY